jgi:Ni,Fe-hydrogenase I cytochrome b subunit
MGFHPLSTVGLDLISIVITLISEEGFTLVNKHYEHTIYAFYEVVFVKLQKGSAFTWPTLQPVNTNARIDKTTWRPTSFLLS